MPDRRLLLIAMSGVRIVNHELKALGPSGLGIQFEYPGCPVRAQASR